MNTPYIPQALVILESPYAGDIENNLAYAKLALMDCLLRGESPIASHLLFTQPGLLNDNKIADRVAGLRAGWAWIPVCDRVVFYVDHGMSAGMNQAWNIARGLQKPTSFRRLYKNKMPLQLNLPFAIELEMKTDSDLPFEQRLVEQHSATGDSEAPPQTEQTQHP